MHSSGFENRKAQHEMRFAMGISLSVGVLMLIGKVAAYFMTGSAAILSDAAESVVHVVAVAFAAFSLHLSTKPASERFHYGYDRITFFSAGFEGAMIILAAIAIIVSAIYKWVHGLSFENLGAGTLIVVAASLVNAGLGWFLIRTGRRNNSLILEANGKHVLTDSWTSFGVVGGLCLVLFTGWKPFDPLFAIGVALNILWSGGHLVWRSITGLLDYADPETGRKLSVRLDQLCKDHGISHHAARFRTTGQRVLAEVHLLFPQRMSVGEAHVIATAIETKLAAELQIPCDVTTHLESEEDHTEIHAEAHQKSVGD
jgi:cation diffusion facilitator family transporter